MNKKALFSLATVTILCLGSSNTLNAEASSLNHIEAKNQRTGQNQVKKTLILDEILGDKNKSNFKEFNDPFYVTWLGDNYGVICRYDPYMKNGIVTKNPTYVFGGMNYSIKSSTFGEAFVRVKDIDTGEVYLSKQLPQNYSDQELKLTFPKDTKISIQVTAPKSSGDCKLERFTLTLDDI